MEYTDINHQVFGGAHDSYPIYPSALPLSYMPKTFMAETVRFELTGGYKPPAVFKTAALNHSATFPE